MAIVDDKGRIGGRINLIDAVIAVIVLALIPAAVGAYLLFQSPPPKLLTVRPPQVPYGPQQHVDIEGLDLRPFMRISFNDIQGLSFLIGSTKSARVDLPTLPVGTYDVVLYDYRQEVARLKQALTVLPVAAVAAIDMEVAGAFINLNDAQIKETKVGQRFPPGVDSRAEVLSVGDPAPGRLRLRVGEVTLAVPLAYWELPATLKVHCNPSSNPDGSLGCLSYGGQQQTLIAPQGVLLLDGAKGSVQFQISEVHLVSMPALTQAHVAFVVTERQLARMKVGDLDMSPKAAAPLHRAAIVALGASRAVASADAGPRAPVGGALRLVDVTMRVPLERGSGGWTYKDQSVKVGAPFTFETEQYVVAGDVADMTTPTVPAEHTPR